MKKRGASFVETGFYMRLRLTSGVCILSDTRLLAARFLSFVWVGLAGCVWGNPLAITHDAYIAKEELRVTLTESAAEIEGAFVFATALTSAEIGWDSPGRLDVPIWIPTSGRDQGSWHAGLMADARQSTYWKAGDMEGKSWAQFIDLEFVLNKRSLRPAGCWLLLKPAKTQTPAWARDGWMCLLFRFEYEAVDMQKGVQVQLRYQQPYLIKRRSREFFYVPNFDNFFKGQSTNDLSQYQAVLVNRTGADLKFGEMVQPSGTESRWPLSHHRPLVFAFP